MIPRPVSEDMETEMSAPKLDQSAGWQRREALYFPMLRDAKGFEEMRRWFAHDVKPASRS